MPLTRLCIKNFKSIKSCDISFSELNVLIGENGTGKTNMYLVEQFGPEKFISEANKLPLKHRNLRTYPFKTIFQFVQYMCGYRSFLISMIDSHNSLTQFQKELQRLIRRLEAQITLFT